VQASSTLFAFARAPSHVSRLVGWARGEAVADDRLARKEACARTRTNSRNLGLSRFRSSQPPRHAYHGPYRRSSFVVIVTEQVAQQSATGGK
jgi:hypothetical protein